MILAIQILHILVAVFLVLVILLQAGKGAGMGAAFGGAGSQTVFGGRGAQTFLGKLTATAAAIFFLTSLTLSYASSEGGRSVVEGIAPAPATTPTAGPGDRPVLPSDTKAEPATPLEPVAPPSAEGQAPAGEAPAAPAPAPEGQAPATP